MYITQDIPAVLSCTQLHQHDTLNTQWIWNSEDPLAITIIPILNDEYGNPELMPSLGLVLARDLVHACVSTKEHNDPAEHQLYGHKDFVALRVRRTLPNVVILKWPGNILMLQRDKIRKFTIDTYMEVLTETDECEILDLNRTAARLQYWVEA